MRVMVTGGAGFIGSAVCRAFIGHGDEVLVLDKLTYAGNLASLAPVSAHPCFTFVRADVCDRIEVQEAFAQFQPEVVLHLAAESHVDRSIDGPAAFIETNLVGTFVMLEAALAYWRALPAHRAKRFHFQHISTDEVFGSLGKDGLFREETPYAPTSPYSASKAGSDHLVRAWGHTYGLPTIVTNCSNNYGPYHFPEKLIPLTIINAIEERPLTVYGRGENVRDWLFVEDHADALMLVAREGVVGESYNIGGRNEWRNIDVVRAICKLMNDLQPRSSDYLDLIQFVEDRPGHDLRYAIDCSKIERELGWRPRTNFGEGLRATVIWYLQNRSWWEDVRSGNYRGERLGVARGRLDSEAAIMGGRQ